LVEGWRLGGGDALGSGRKWREGHAERKKKKKEYTVITHGTPSGVRGKNRLLRPI